MRLTQFYLRTLLTVVVVVLVYVHHVIGEAVSEQVKRTFSARPQMWFDGLSSLIGGAVVILIVWLVLTKGSKNVWDSTTMLVAGTAFTWGPLLGIMYQLRSTPYELLLPWLPPVPRLMGSLLFFLGLVGVWQSATKVGRGD